MSSAIPSRRRRGRRSNAIGIPTRAQKAAKRTARTSSGVPLTGRGSHYAVLPDRIPIYRGPLVLL